eukprot:574180-Amphidinium_carterae.1
MERGAHVTFNSFPCHEDARSNAASRSLTDHLKPHVPRVLPILSQYADSSEEIEWVLNCWLFTGESMYASAALLHVELDVEIFDPTAIRGDAEMLLE